MKSQPFLYIIRYSKQTLKINELKMAALLNKAAE